MPVKQGKKLIKSQYLCRAAGKLQSCALDVSGEEDFRTANQGQAKGTHGAGKILLKIVVRLASHNGGSQAQQMEDKF